MTGRILTPHEWSELERAEAAIYARNMGMCGVTDVRERSESQYLAAMWDESMSGCEMLVGDEYPDTAAAVAEVARRVAAAQHYLIVGELP